MKFALISLALMALVGTACAQLTPCLEDCIATAEAEAGCSGLNIPCMCESSAFQADMLACLNAKCTPADLAAAKKFEAEFCGTS